MSSKSATEITLIELLSRLLLLSGSRVSDETTTGLLMTVSIASTLVVMCITTDLPFLRSPIVQIPVSGSYFPLVSSEM